MEVKVCNLRASGFELDFKESVTNTGFAVLTHHGIDHGLIRETQQAWRAFFNQDQGYKESFINDEDGNMGYKGFGSERAVGAKLADLKEFYHWKPGQKVPFELTSLTHVMFEQLEDISGQLLHVIDGSENTEYRKACESSDNTILRTLYYPAMRDIVAHPGAVRAAAHEDINFITLLVAASAPGLQVLDKEGKWHNVPHEENSIVVNIGDMLQLASKGLYRSTTHRVVNPDGSSSDRVSMPLFVHPRSNTLLADGITAGEFLAQRIAEIYSASQK